MTVPTKCLSMQSVQHVWEHSSYRNYIIKNKKWKYYDFVHIIYCMCKFTCVCACACVWDHKCLREQCAYQRGMGWRLKKILEFCSYRTCRYMFLWTRKLKKMKGIEENHIVIYNTLKYGFIYQHKKYFRDRISKIQLKIKHFCHLPDLRKCLE